MIFRLDPTVQFSPPLGDFTFRDLEIVKKTKLTELISGLDTELTRTLQLIEVVFGVIHLKELTAPGLETIDGATRIHELPLFVEYSIFTFVIVTPDVQVMF